ncbi:MAG TPA: hypothetical protein VF589_06230 [Allosphingosinicella sp.]
MLLLNTAELEVRLQAFLHAAGWTRALCGHWYFTWNAFQIQCDPKSVLATIPDFDLRSTDLREGAVYRDKAARRPGTLTRRPGKADEARFAVVMEADPDAVRRARAEADVVVGEIMQKPVTLEAALRERMKEDVSGTIEVVFEADPAGDARRRTKVTRLRISAPGEPPEIDVRTETLERGLASGPAALAKQPL